MATRFYFPSTGSPDVTPDSWSAGWDKSDQGVGPFPLATEKAATALTDTVSTASLTSPNPAMIAVGRWVSAPLAAQTISGTLTGVMRCFESSTATNATIALAVKVVQPDGSDRGVILAVTSSDSVTQEMNTVSFTSTRLFMDAAESSTVTLSSVAVSAGDYLVVEIGYRENDAATTARVANARYGDTGDDFAHTEGLTTDLTPWVEFSGDISFQPASQPMLLFKRRRDGLRLRT